MSTSMTWRELNRLLEKAIKAGWGEEKAFVETEGRIFNIGSGRKRDGYLFLTVLGGLAKH